MPKHGAPSKSGERFYSVIADRRIRVGVRVRQLTLFKQSWGEGGAGNRKPDPLQPSIPTKPQNENGELLQDHSLVELAVFVGILPFRKEADMLDLTDSNCYRLHWRIFKVQLWCLFLTHKLILLCAKYVLLNTF